MVALKSDIKNHIDIARTRNARRVRQWLEVHEMIEYKRSGSTVHLIKQGK
jgi:hypothetical protein